MKFYLCANCPLPLKNSVLVSTNLKNFSTTIKIKWKTYIISSSRCDSSSRVLLNWKFKFPRQFSKFLEMTTPPDNRILYVFHLIFIVVARWWNDRMTRKGMVCDFTKGTAKIFYALCLIFLGWLVTFLLRVCYDCSIIKF